MFSIQRKLKRSKHLGYISYLRASNYVEAFTHRLSRYQRYRQVRTHLDLPEISRSKGLIWGISMVKNERDIIEGTLTHLFQEGVDRVLIVDNMSGDGTYELLHDLARKYPIYVGKDSLEAYFQSEKMTVLADHVAKAGAKWIVPFDADELWCGTGGRSLSAALSSASTSVVRAELVNLFPSPDSSTSWQIDVQAHPDAKVAFRPFPLAVVGMGNHRVHHPGKIGDALGIIHVPWRSFEQFQRKVHQGGRALKLAGETVNGYHWAMLSSLDTEALRRAWDLMLGGVAIEGNTWQPQGQLHPTRCPGRISWNDVEEIRGASK